MTDSDAQRLRDFDACTREALIASRRRRDLELLEEGNEDGSNRDVPPFDNDPRTDEEIKQAVYDRADEDDWS